jgi:HAD superfamily hydrolase (TIGR01509 family)
MSDNRAPNVIMTIKAVVLDMDGLMLDTEFIYQRAWQRAAAELGFDIEDGFYWTLIGRTTADGEAALRERFGDHFPVAKFRERWEQLWHTHVDEQGIPTKPGLHEFLALLEGHRIPFAIATSSDREYATLSLRAAHLESSSHYLVTGDQVEQGKPAPDIYLEAARRLGVDPSGCLALEDSEAGIVAAVSAGMYAVLIPALKAPSEQARCAAWSVLASLHDAVKLVSGLLVSRGQAG